MSTLLLSSIEDLSSNEDNFSHLCIVKSSRFLPNSSADSGFSYHEGIWDEISGNSGQIGPMVAAGTTVGIAGTAKWATRWCLLLTRARRLERLSTPRRVT